MARNNKAKRVRRWLRKRLAEERKVGVSVAAGAVHRAPIRERYLDDEATEALANLGERINANLGRSRLQSNWRDDTPANNVRPGIADPEYTRVSEVRLMDGTIVLKRAEGKEYTREEGATRNGGVRRMRMLVPYVQRDLPRDPIGPVRPFHGFIWEERVEGIRANIPAATQAVAPRACVRIVCPGGDPLPIRN